jgi:4-amino-4-deoxychorismate lyase
MRVLVMLDGTVADPDQPRLRVDDLGLIRGDGVFETILVVDGKPRELGPHLDRLARSAAMLDLPAPDRDAWTRCVDAVLARWTEPECALKLVYTRGIEGGDGTPTGFALGMEIAAKTRRQRAEGIAAITLDRGIEPGVAERAPWLLLGAKSLSYAVNMAAGREAARRGADDVIFTEAGGHILEGPTSTVVVAQGHTLRTPPRPSASCPAPPSSRCSARRSGPAGRSRWNRSGWPT